MWDWMLGRITLEITCADTTTLLNAVTRAKIKLYSVNISGDLTVKLSVAKENYQKVSAIAEKQGAKLKIINMKGIYWTIRSFIKRPVLVVFAALLIILSVYLPGRVLFITVEGNHTVPTNLILEAAEESGIGFGANRRQVRSEKVKNALLEKIPQLQWAGINTSGCTAIISVREKTTQEIPTNNNNTVSSIVAMRDGVIQSCTVYQGNPLCSVGQVVKAGQILVSGYLDCGVVTKTTQSDAEIMALTSRELRVVSPVLNVSRGEVIKKRTEYGIIIGKKLIKFHKGSGNLDATCAKIYEEVNIRFPGGFTIPVSLVKQTYYTYKVNQQAQASAELDAWLNDFAKDYLQSTMIAGEILFAEDSLNVTDKAAYLQGQYACVEMIGQVKFEQTMVKDDK